MARLDWVLAPSPSRVQFCARSRAKWGTASGPRHLKGWAPELGIQSANSPPERSVASARPLKGWSEVKTFSGCICAPASLQILPLPNPQFRCHELHPSWIYRPTHFFPACLT